jgi:hypothetical protein
MVAGQVSAWMQEQKQVHGATRVMFWQLPFGARSDFAHTSAIQVNSCTLQIIFHSAFSQNAALAEEAAHAHEARVQARRQGCVLSFWIVLVLVLVQIMCACLPLS